MHPDFLANETTRRPVNKKQKTNTHTQKPQQIHSIRIYTSWTDAADVCGFFSDVSRRHFGTSR